MRCSRGMARKEAIASDLQYGDFVVYGHRISQDNWGQPYRVALGFMCPVCESFHIRQLRHGEHVLCGCGLRITRYGDELECT